MLEEKFVSSIEVGVRGVRVVELPRIEDPRGNLSVMEFEKDLPFVPARCFWIYNVPGHHVRGEHSHRRLEQFLVCVKGACVITVDDGRNRADVALDRPNRGLYLPPLIWDMMHQFSHDAVLMVLASERYDPAEYIRNYDEFLQLINQYESTFP